METKDTHLTKIYFPVSKMHCVRMIYLNWTEFEHQASPTIQVHPFMATFYRLKPYLEGIKCPQGSWGNFLFHRSFSVNIFPSGWGHVSVFLHPQRSTLQAELCR